MGSEAKELHVVLFPLMAYGHMIPTLDIARLFASRDVKVTIITTPKNAPVFTKSLNKTQKNLPLPIHIETFNFPSKQVGLPAGVENWADITTEDMLFKFIKALELLEEPFQKLAEEQRPDCIVADIFLPRYVIDVAANYNIPRLVFRGTSYFSTCVTENLQIYEPHETVSSEDEQFVLPNFPHEIKFTRSMLPSDLTKDKGAKFGEWIRKSHESERNSYGALMNSFYELEPTYVDHHKNELGQRSWAIGPVSLFNRIIEEDSSVIDQHECLKWLDSKQPNSVVYVCFGSMAKFTSPQLQEIAVGLEACEQNFIWVIRNEEESLQIFLKEFEKRIEGKGLIIRGWAPQVLILNHEAIGAFVTHCGWNSILEGVSAGKPMVTWPTAAEQFYNDKLVTEILRNGIPIGCHRQLDVGKNEVSVKGNDVEKAVRKIMAGEEYSTEIRERAKKLKEMAWKAIKEGGSSYSDLTALIQELRDRKNSS